MKFTGYDTGPFYDEMFSSPGVPREGARLLMEKIEALPGGELPGRQHKAEQALYDLGITFCARVAPGVRPFLGVGSVGRRQYPRHGVAFRTSP